MTKELEETVGFGISSWTLRSGSFDFRESGLSNFEQMLAHEAMMEIKEEFAVEHRETYISMLKCNAKYIFKGITPKEAKFYLQWLLINFDL